MAKLLLINSKTKTSVNNLGDIVAIMEDSHEFSPAEKDGFDIVQVKETRKEAETTLQAKLPTITELNKDSYTSPKYPFKVTNKTAKTIDSMCVINIVAK